MFVDVSPILFAIAGGHVGFGLTDLGSAKPLITPFIEKAGLFSMKVTIGSPEGLKS